MARQRKSKLFELFSSSFRVTDFYKPTMSDGDIYYYVLIDDIIKLRMTIIDNVVVIDCVESVTTTYIKPIYEKLVQVIMNQSKLTVIVSMIGNTFAIQQACITNNAPIVEDERYITVALSYYNRIKKKYKDDTTQYGFYILSVSDDDEVNNKPGETSPVSVNHTPIGVEPPILKVAKILLSSLKNDFPGVKTEPASSDAIRCYLSETEDFVVEIAKGDIYIKDLLQKNSGNPFNLIKLMQLITTFEKLTIIQPNVYILSIQNAELNRICEMKGYYNIPEEKKLPMNHLFKQSFSGYGTYRITN